VGRDGASHQKEEEPVMGMIKEFRDFAMRGNVIDMAVGIIIGAAFGTIVKTMVDKVIMPPIGMMMGKVDFADLKLVLQDAVPASVGEGGAEIAEVAEVAIYYGELFNAILSFVIVAFCLFLIIKAMNKATAAMEKEKEAAPPPPPAEEVVLLREIRDSLNKG
jgi:large conductance mechanosensitive channel